MSHDYELIQKAKKLYLQLYGDYPKTALQLNKALLLLNYDEEELEEMGLREDMQRPGLSFV